jgi:hypothetical protein
MKKITFLLLAILPMLGLAQTFDFTNTVDGWDAATTGATLVPNSTFVAVNLTDGVSNPKFGSATAGVDGVTNKVCAVTLQNLSASGPTYMRVSFAKAAGGRYYSNLDITAGDSGYQTYYFDLTNADWGNDVPENDIQIHFKAAGNATYTVPTGGVTVNVDKIEFIASIPTTLQETYTFNTDNDTEGFTTTNGSISGPSSGILTFTPDATKYAKLDQLTHHVDATAHKQVHITLKNNSAANDQLRFVYYPAGGGQVTRTQTMSTSDAMEHTYTFDLSDAGVDPDWTGNITFTVGIGSLLDGKAQDAGTVEFNSIIIDNTLNAKNFNKAEFTMYPNPAKGLVYLNSANKISKVTIFDISGKQVLTTSRLSNNAINVSALKAVYTY